MMTKFEWWIVGIVALIVITAGEVMLRDKPYVVTYDCRMVDVSPDIPEQVKQMCRSRR